MQTNRSYNSLSSVQSLLSKYEQQVMSQRQYQYGSDSPYNASTTLTVQAQVERKKQNASNLLSTQTFLSATDSTLSRFNALTDNARAMALEAINTHTSAEQRSALAQTVTQTLQQVFDFGNYSFEGRYVFAGSSTASRPFQWGSDSYTVRYNGNETNVQSWSDTDLLSQSNMNGVDVFGAISEPVRGKTDLDPALDRNTLLSDLNNGKGVDKGSIRFTYTVDSTVKTFDVDLSQCATVGDVERAIENSKNPYFSVSVDITRNGLEFSLPPTTVGSVSISEIGRGTIARQLGIPTGKEFNRTEPLIGLDVNPALKTTTLLSDILGSKANTTLRFAGSNNDILLQSSHNGDELNGVKVAIRAETVIPQGEEYVEYDSDTKQLLIHIHPDNSSANDIIQAINDASAAGTIPGFTASLSTTDQQRSDVAGSGIISLLPGESLLVGEMTGGFGIDFDSTGIQLVNDNVIRSISFEKCQTVGDLLAELNNPDYGLYATINNTKDGIDIRSRISGADFCIGESGGTTATQLGIRTNDLDTRLESLDFGRGVSDYDGPGTSASARYTSVTPNSSLVLTARNEGKSWNDYTINYVPTSDPQGKVAVSMDEETKTITIGINPGVTTACEVIDAFNSQPGPKQFFDLTLDTTNGINTGEGVIYDGFAKTTGGSDGGIDFTITRNDGTALDIDIHGAETIEDVLRIINNHVDNKDGLLVATLAKNGNGIELTDKSFGNSVTRVDRTLLSTSAIELGLINMGEEYRTKTTAGTEASASVNSIALNGTLLVTAKSVGTYANDAKIEFVEGTPPGFMYDAASKTLRFSIEPGVTTANDVVELFQTQASETVRSMFDIRSGVNANGLPSDGSGAVTLGSSTLSGGTDSVLTGNDPNPQETESLYNALIRLQVAMTKNDTREIERATQLLDESVAKLDASRATLGVMQNSLDNVQARLDEEAVQHQETLNYTLRIDYADASLAFLAQQLSYQASMQVATTMLQMSLLNYL
jgi:flagellin-like hook-associated protein FlgL